MKNLKFYAILLAIFTVVVGIKSVSHTKRVSRPAPMAETAQAEPAPVAPVRIVIVYGAAGTERAPEGAAKPTSAPSAKQLRMAAFEAEAGFIIERGTTNRIVTGKLRTARDRYVGALASR